MQASPYWMGRCGHHSSSFQRGAAARGVGRHEDIEISSAAVCGQGAQKTNCSFQTSCVANRQGWENKKREILPGDKASAATRMMAKQGLGEENRVAACRTFDQVMKIQGQKSSLGCFGQLNCFILPSLSNRQETDLPVCLGFFRRKEYECFNSPTTT